MTPTLIAAQEFQRAYDHFNRELFEGKLPPCLITFQRSINCAGYYFFERFVRADGQRTDEIAMNPEHFAKYSLVYILQTLVHEMVHLWQQHFGKPSVKTYHNKEWAAKMRAVGLMPSSTGQPGGAQTGQKMSDYPIQGGAFLAASESLVATEFSVSWCDRVVPVYEGGKELPLEVSSLLAAKPVPTNLVVPAHSACRTTREKYRCPGCAVQAWGKPGLRLLCEDCETSLEAVES